MERMRLSIPADEKWTIVMRRALCGVSAVYDLPCDVLDDLNAAVDESCDLLLHQEKCIEALTLLVKEKKDGVHISIIGEPCSEGRRQHCSADEETSRLLLESLVRRVDMENKDNCVREVRMVLPASVETDER